jgi:predicted enzyme related to lactoylglutathione lyase
MNLLVNIDVDDLEKAIRFYSTALHLTVGRRLGAGIVEMLGASSPIYLLLRDAGSESAGAVSQRRDFSRHWTPVHLDLVVEDIDAAVRQASAAGATLEAPISTANWGRLARMADPFGHGFCFVQLLGRGYDEIAGT